MKTQSTIATSILFFAASSFVWEGVSGLAIDRKTFWKHLGATGAAAVVLGPTTAGAFDPYTFNHQYDDPQHPNCKRIVVVKRDGVAMISGTEGNPACPEDGSGEVWRLVGEAEGPNLVVDFSLAGGPDEVKGKWDENGIKWSDGNKWFIKGMRPAEPDAEKESPPGEATAAAPS